MYPPKLEEVLDIIRKGIRNKIQQNFVLKQNNIAAKLENHVLKKLHFQKEIKLEEIQKNH